MGHPGLGVIRNAIEGAAESRAAPSIAFRRRTEGQPRQVLALRFCALWRSTSMALFIPLFENT